MDPRNEAALTTASPAPPRLEPELGQQLREFLLDTRQHLSGVLAAKDLAHTLEKRSRRLVVILTVNTRRATDAFDVRDRFQIRLRDIHVGVFGHRLNGGYKPAGDRTPGLDRRTGDVAHVLNRRVLGFRILGDGLTPAANRATRLTAGIGRQG